MKPLTIAANEWRFIWSQKEHKFTSCVWSLTCGGFSKMQKGGSDWAEGTQLISGRTKVTVYSSQPRLFRQWHWLCCRRRKELGIWSAGLPPVAPPATLPTAAGDAFQGLENRVFLLRINRMNGSEWWAPNGLSSQIRVEIGRWVNIDILSPKAHNGFTYFFLLAEGWLTSDYLKN